MRRYATVRKREWFHVEHALNDDALEAVADELLDRFGTDARWEDDGPIAGWRIALASDARVDERALLAAQKRAAKSSCVVVGEDWRENRARCSCSRATS